jgi:hypothetical protein
VSNHRIRDVNRTARVAGRSLIFPSQQGDANPREDIRNTLTISGVMLGGRWLESAELQKLVAAGARAIDGLAPRQTR